MSDADDKTTEWSIKPLALSGDDDVQVVLASASTSRRMMLLRAGIAGIVDPAHIDEAEVKAALRSEGASAMQAAETLAELKARHVTRRHPGALVIGADQILDCDGIWYDKPDNMDQVRDQLRALAGKKHSLETAVCVLRDDTRLWHHNARAILRMRPFTDDFLNAYMETVGEHVLASVGAYRLEGAGIQLFEAVEGDYFTILGLPLLPLLGFLRAQGAVQT